MKIKEQLSIRTIKYNFGFFSIIKMPGYINIPNWFGCWYEKWKLQIVFCYKGNEFLRLKI